MKLIVGLGNPGRAYKNTRHNIGFMFIDVLAKQKDTKFRLDRKLKCEITEFRHLDEMVLLIKPMTYMNLSGEAVAAVSRFYSIEPDDIIVVYDDKDLPSGKIRIRRNGSSGGHNGMRSIIDKLGTDQIKRIRIGIGNNDAIDARDYVLGKISKTDAAVFDAVFKEASDMFDFMLAHSFDDFMGKYN